MPETSTTEPPRPIDAPRKPKHVEKFGDHLRRQREMRGISLEEIAEATKIGTRSLRALEQEKFDQLPGGIFNKGFVRAYAKYLGIDEEQAVADYVAAMSDQQTESDPAQLQEIARQVQAQREQISKSQNNTLMWFGVFLIAAIIGLGAYGWHAWQHDKADRAAEAARQQEAQRQAEQLAQQQTLQAQQTAAAPVDPNAAAPAGTQTGTAPQTATPTGTTPAPTTTPTITPQKPSTAIQASSNAAPVSLTLKATARTWVSVTVDGGKAQTMTLDPSDPKLASKTFDGTEKVFLITGNPAGIDATLNGKPVGSLGPVGQRRQVMFTPQGKQEVAKQP